MTQNLHRPKLHLSPQRRQVRSGLTVTLNLTSRGVRKQRAKGLSVYLTGPGRIDGGERWKEGLLAGSIQVMGMREGSGGDGERNSGPLYQR